jgi:acetoin utilization deacetylase AcuC-like enzyme
LKTKSTKGVQDAFELTDKVMCVSFHKFTAGFFPGTGSLDELGKDKGKYYTVNVPLLSGIDDGMFFQVFSK